MSSTGREAEEGEVLEGDVVSLNDSSLTLSAVERAGIDTQIATAKQYPRVLTECIRDAKTLATLDQETAGTMMYALPRGGKAIEGPSARLAEVVASSWGNLRVDADIVGEDATHVTAMGTCFDVEKNVAIRVRVKRRITDKNGRRFNEDMIGVTSNAAISIALRNAVFKVVPPALWQSVYRAARHASLGDGGTMQQKRQGAGDWIKKIGVTETEMFAALGVKGWDDVGEDELITLRGYRTSIQEGEIDADRIFRPEPTTRSDASKELDDAVEGVVDAPETPSEPETVATGADTTPEVMEADMGDDSAPGDDSEAEDEPEPPKPPPKRRKRAAKPRTPAGEGNTTPEPETAENGDESAPQDDSEGNGDPPGDDAMPQTAEDLIPAIEALEKEIDLKGRGRDSRRRRLTGDTDLPGAEIEGLQAYYRHLQDCRA